MRHRDWPVDTPASVATTVDAFRVFATTRTVRSVTMFAGASTTPERIEQCVRRADAETRALVPRQLVVLIIRTDAPTVHPNAQAYLDSINLHAERSRVCYVECWHTRDLLIDVLGHCDQSPHRRATPSERAAYPLAQLPLMRLSDPVARRLGMRENDVIVEERTDPDVGRSLYYRRIVARGGDSG